MNHDLPLIDHLLLRAQGDASAATQLASALPDLCADSPLPLKLALLAADAQSQWIYAYLPLAQAQVLAPGPVRALALTWAERLPGLKQLDLSRLQKVFEAPGHSSGQAPAHHYAVETDPQTGWFDEISRWYDQEHMPGLAQVPGCTLAQRFLNHDSGPVSHACYGLLQEEVMGCPPWLAVRGTDWSSRCRPHFTNTRRTLMRRLPLAN